MSLNFRIRWVVLAAILLLVSGLAATAGPTSDSIAVRSAISAGAESSSQALHFARSVTNLQILNAAFTHPTKGCEFSLHDAGPLFIAGLPAVRIYTANSHSSRAPPTT
jgi:hypothetical protein